MTPTPEGEHILDLHRSTSDNLLIEAYAGCGKTTQLEQIIEQIKDNVLYLTFNTRNKEVAEERLNEKAQEEIWLPPYKVQTLNSFGHGVWTKAINKKLSLDKLKNQEILRGILKANRSLKEGWDIFSEVIGAIALAKSLGYVPDGKFPGSQRLCDLETLQSRFAEDIGPLGWELVDAVIIKSIVAAHDGLVDYDDQVYMPAVFGAPFPVFPTVLVDELQDLSPTNLALLDYLTESRLIGVGDDAQSIYQFRGAQQGGMARFAEKHKATRATLSVSFRCPRAICENAQWRVPIRWMKEGGRVARLYSPSHTTFPDSCAVICRNNAPLFNLAFRLLSSGRSVNVGGSDIGPRLLNTLRKLGPGDLTRDAVYDAIEAWRNEKLSRGSTTADDMADAMRVFARYGKDLAQALAYAEDLFKRSGTITLLTGHKSKGLEFPIVFHLDPWLIRDTEQERNLRYVIQTRAMETYYEIVSEEIRW